MNEQDLIREIEADERIRDAAPDLLEAAKAVIADIRKYAPTSEIRNPPVVALIAAIFKAEGRQ